MASSKLKQVVACYFWYIFTDSQGKERRNSSHTDPPFEPIQVNLGQRYFGVQVGFRPYREYPHYWSLCLCSGRKDGSTFPRRQLPSLVYGVTWWPSLVVLVPVLDIAFPLLSESWSFSAPLKHLKFCHPRIKALLFTLIRAFEFELAVPPNDIIKKAEIVQRPLVKSDPEGGNQMPLLLKPVQRG